MEYTELFIIPNGIRLKTVKECRAEPLRPTKEKTKKPPDHGYVPSSVV